MHDMKYDFYNVQADPCRLMRDGLKLHHVSGWKLGEKISINDSSTVFFTP